MPSASTNWQVYFLFGPACRLTVTMETQHVCLRRLRPVPSARSSVPASSRHRRLPTRQKKPGGLRTVHRRVTSPTPPGSEPASEGETERRQET